nr:unnamed protein product [Digitaria exilis]
MSHVVTTVRGTVGRIPPEYFMSGQASEKTDVFCFGLLLIELVTGRETLELHQNEYPKGGIIEWIALLCTMYKPEHRPRMSEVVTMLEGGDGVADKWEAMKNIEELNPDKLYQAIKYDEDQFSSTELQSIELSGPR